MQLPNGNYLKVFRLRHRFGWARLHGYAQRFCKHAVKLQQLGVPTVTVKQCYQVEDQTLLHTPATRLSPSQHTYVVEYMPLAGQTLKHLLSQGLLTDRHVEQLGGFIAELHAKGIYFRSLHLGNIVLTPEGQLGLIDIADMDIYPWALWFNTRLRSFRHMTRYRKLNDAFGQKNWSLLEHSYLQQANLHWLWVLKLRHSMRSFLQHPPH